MPRSTKDSPPNPLTVFLFGSAGSGKSTLALRFPKPYWIDVDRNQRGPKKVAELEKRPFDFPYDVLNETDDGKPLESKDQYKRLCELLAAATANPAYETIILDSTTTLVDVFMNEVLRQTGKAGNSKPEFEHYRLVIHLWKHFVTTLRKSGKHNVIIGHDRVEKDPFNDSKSFEIAIPGQTGDLIPALVTDVWKCYVDQKIDATGVNHKYMVRTSQNAQERHLKSTVAMPSSWEATQANVDKALSYYKQPTPSK